MKKAIVVGATSGIGKELARILAANGYKVGITGRRTPLLDELAKEKPGSYIPKTFDVTCSQESAVKLNELTSELGGLDLLVINSGTGEINKTLDFSIEKKTIDTNVTGFTCVADWAFNFFEKQGSGHLAAISSVGGLRGNGISPSYYATKSFQINYLEGLRHKTAKRKIQVTVSDIRPGFVKTDMLKGNGFFWVSTAENAAKQIFSAISKKKKVAYVTKRWAIVAFILKIMPRSIYNRM